MSERIETDLQAAERIRAQETVHPHTEAIRYLAEKRGCTSSIVAERLRQFLAYIEILFGEEAAYQLGESLAVFERPKEPEPKELNHGVTKGTEEEESADSSLPTSAPDVDAGDSNPQPPDAESGDNEPHGAD